MNQYAWREGMDHKQLKRAIVNFLSGDGGNEKLARMIEKGGTLYGPTRVALQQLRRLCGPEETMKWREPPAEWEERVSRIVSLMENGWEAPPFIIWFLHGRLELADGSHRFEALKRLGRASHPAIIWCDDEKAQKTFLKKYAKHLDG